MAALAIERLEHSPRSALQLVEKAPAQPRRRIPAGVLVGGGIVAVLMVVAILAPVIAPDNPIQGSVANRLLGVGSPGHLLGTDSQGRDLLSRLIWGARPSLLSGILPVLAAGMAGVTLGVVAGLSGPKVHAVVMRTLDVFYAFPAVLLAIAIAAALGPGMSNAIAALSVVLIPPIARVAETEVARIRTADFMDAARTSGASWLAVALRQVLPNIAPPVLVYCTALMGLSMVYAGGLSFLGLGIAPPNPEWGLILNDLRQNLFDSPTLALIPAVAILVTSVAFNVLGDGLRDLLDVRAETVS